MEPLILHLETSERLCSICLSHGEQCLDRIDDDKGDHQSTLAPNIKNILIDNGLNLSNLDAISVNIGPGSYTSLRVGVIMAKGLSFLNNKPLIALTGLKVLAWESVLFNPNKATHIPLIDARRDDAYFAVYDTTLNELIAPQFASLSPQWFKDMGFDSDTCVISGSGSSKWGSLLPDYQVTILNSKLSSQMLIKPALESFYKERFVSPSELQPYYIKDPNITIAKKKL